MTPDLVSQIPPALFQANKRGAEPRRKHWQCILPVAMLVPLAACAGGRVENVALAPAHAPTSAAFRIDVSLAPDLQMMPAAGRVAQAL